MIVRKQFRAILEETKLIDFPSIAANSSNDQTIAVPGARVGDVVNVGLGAAPNTGLTFTAFCVAANVVTVRCANGTVGAIDPAAQTFRVQVMQLN